MPMSSNFPVAGPGGFRDLYLGERAKVSCLELGRIEVEREIEMRDTGLLSFKLFFPPLPRGVNSIDVIESRMNLGGWHIWGLNLNPVLKWPRWLSVGRVCPGLEEATTLPPAELKTGKTRVKVRLCGYRDLMDGRDVELFVSDMFSPGKELSKRIESGSQLYV